MKKLTLFLFIFFNCINSYSQEFGFTEQDIIINKNGNRNLKDRQYYVYNGKKEISKVLLKIIYAHYVEDMSIQNMNDALLQLNTYLLSHYNESQSLEIEKIKVSQGRNMMRDDPKNVYMKVGIDFYAIVEGAKKLLHHSYYIDREGKLKTFYEGDFSHYDNDYY